MYGESGNPGVPEFLLGLVESRAQIKKETLRPVSLLQQIDGEARQLSEKFALLIGKRIPWVLINHAHCPDEMTG